MNAVENQVRELVKVELDAANERFPQFHSQHEGYAVLLEEVDELGDEVDAIEGHMRDQWSNIRANEASLYAIKSIESRAVRAACEAIQVAAMCQKFLEMEAKDA